MGSFEVNDGIETGRGQKRDRVGYNCHYHELIAGKEKGMTTIRLPDELVKRLQTNGVANVETFIENVLRQMGDSDITAVSEHINQQSLLQENAETRIAALLAGFAEMREGLSREELKELSDVINYEYIEPFNDKLFQDDLPGSEA